MSLTTTGMSAAAIAWAISPPIVPPPTTAALLTNMRLGSSLCALAGRPAAARNWEAIRMEGATTSERDELLAFELALDEKVCDEVHRESWGRLFLTASAPLIWDANWVAVEEVGLSVEQVVAIADDALGGEGFGHRTIGLLDQADGRRIGAEI